MSSTNWPRRGEIWRGYTPGQPDDPHQPRPILIISVNARNRLTDDVTVIPVFSSGVAGPTRVPLPQGVGGLPHASVLFCEEITTIDRDFLESGPFGPPLSPELLERVVLAILNAIEP